MIEIRPVERVHHFAILIRHREWFIGLGVERHIADAAEEGRADERDVDAVGAIAIDAGLHVVAIREGAAIGHPSQVVERVRWFVADERLDRRCDERCLGALARQHRGWRQRCRAVRRVDAVGR